MLRDPKTNSYLAKLGHADQTGILVSAQHTDQKYVNTPMTEGQATLLSRPTADCNMSDEFLFTGSRELAVRGIDHR